VGRAQLVSVSGCHQHLTDGWAATRAFAPDEVPVSIGGHVERRSGIRANIGG
jgi:hypothetical protein